MASAVGGEDRADASNFCFTSLLFVVIIRQNRPFRHRRRHPALFAAHVPEYISALDARKLATLVNGHGPLDRLPVGFHAKSAIFLASAEKSCFSRCDAGALAVGELVSRTAEDSNELHEIVSREGKPLARQRLTHFLGFSRHQPSACALLRRSRGGFTPFCLLLGYLVNK